MVLPCIATSSLRWAIHLPAPYSSAGLVVWQFTAVLRLVYYSSGSPLLEMGPPRRGLVNFPSRTVYTNPRTALVLYYCFDRVSVPVFQSVAGLFGGEGPVDFGCGGISVGLPNQASPSGCWALPMRWFGHCWERAENSISVLLSQEPRVGAK